MSQEIAFAIPSYRRSGKVKTLHMLECYGVSKDHIYIFVQDKNDEEKYSKEYHHRANVIYKKANNCAGNRNNALNYLRNKGYKYILLMDDDVSSLMRIVPCKNGKSRYKSKTIRLTGGQESKDKFAKLIEEHKQLIDGGATLVSVYGESPLNLVNKKQLRKKIGLTRGTYMFFGEDSPQFNEDMPCCDDFELSARIIVEGKDAIVDETTCLNTVSVKETAKNGNLGGCSEYYTSSENAIVDVQRKYIIEPYGAIIGSKLCGGGDVNRYYSLFVKNVR